MDRTTVAASRLVLPVLVFAGIGGLVLSPPLITQANTTGAFQPSLAHVVFSALAFLGIYLWTAPLLVGRLPDRLIKILLRVGAAAGILLCLLDIVLFDASGWDIFFLATVSMTVVLGATLVLRGRIAKSVGLLLAASVVLPCAFLNLLMLANIPWRTIPAHTLPPIQATPAQIENYDALVRMVPRGTESTLLESQLLDSEVVFATRPQLFSLNSPLPDSITRETLAPYEPALDQLLNALATADARGGMNATTDSILDFITLRRAFQLEVMTINVLARDEVDAEALQRLHRLTRGVTNFVAINDSLVTGMIATAFADHLVKLILRHSPSLSQRDIGIFADQLARLETNLHRVPAAAMLAEYRYMATIANSLEDLQRQTPGIPPGFFSPDGAVDFLNHRMALRSARWPFYSKARTLHDLARYWTPYIRGLDTIPTANGRIELQERHDDVLNTLISTFPKLPLVNQVGRAIFVTETPSFQRAIVRIGLAEARAAAARRLLLDRIGDTRTVVINPIDGTPMVGGDGVVDIRDGMSAGMLCAAKDIAEEEDFILSMGGSSR